MGISDVVFDSALNAKSETTHLVDSGSVGEENGRGKDKSDGSDHSSGS